MIVPGFVFPALMLAGAVLLLVAALLQMKLLQAAPAKPFAAAGDGHALNSLRATPQWKRMRVLLWTGAFLLILGALMQLPELFR